MNELDFEAWLVHPITQALITKATNNAEAAKVRWQAASWGTPIGELDKLDVTQLAYLRGKAEIFESVAKIAYKDLFKRSNRANEAE
jgi:hypothetical protein